MNTLDGLVERLEHEEPIALPAGYRPAGVVALLHGEAADPALLFTERQPTLPDHGGQISFPGGALEAGETYWLAAVRECAEELGIDPLQGRRLGRLPAVAIPSSRFLAVPFVVYVAKPILTHQIRSSAEVTHAFSHPLSQLRAWRHLEEASLGGRGPGLWPTFDLPEGLLWGATAIMTDQLLARWQASAGLLA